MCWGGGMVHLAHGDTAPTEGILTALINEIATIATRVILVLDDYHLRRVPRYVGRTQAGAWPGEYHEEMVPSWAESRMLPSKQVTPNNSMQRTALRAASG